MKITFVLPVADMGGGVRVVVIYGKALTRMGHSVTVVSAPPPPPPLRRRIKSLLKGTGWMRTERAFASHLEGSGLDHRVLERCRPVTDADVPDADVVIATWWETAEWVAALNERKGAKVYFVQGHEVFPHLPVTRCHATYRLPMHKIVIARWLADVMREQYGDGLVEVVPNSADPTQFFADMRGKQALPTVGFLYSSPLLKGVDVALQAISAVRKKMPTLRVLSFGSEFPTAELPLPDWVEFVHSPPQDQLRNCYAQCDAWLSASRSEGFNLTAMEAMMCRTPVVATRTGWPAEAIQSKWNGVLVDIDDAAGLANGLEWILTLPEPEWRHLSERAYATASAGSWDESARKFEAALKHACSRAARGEIAGGGVAA